MSSIKWEDGAVFYANGTQFREGCGGFQRYNDILESWQRTISGDELDKTLKSTDFQLNEMRIGDYIEASELDTEQKYNDAVEVFELFGFEFQDYGVSAYSNLGNADSLVCCDDGLWQTCSNKWSNRKLTYPQLMAIGKLKRAMIEKSAPKTTPELSPDIEINSDWSDEHYNHFYQLSEEDIKAGQIKVDAYFVNRMWKINSWEDTGAGFHILKTLPRIANNKNSLKRELTALKKQVDILCKLHGVDDDTN